VSQDDHRIPAFRTVPRTGVIYVTTEASKLGYRPTDPEWCNLGQGQPETGELPGAPPRVAAVAVDVADLEYAPVAGIWEVREAIASLYNRLYRRGMPGQYSAENVAIAGGGRTSLTRAAASLGQVNLGHFLPDYTAYEELLDVFKAFTAIPILLEGERGYAFTSDDLRKEIQGRGLSALLFSNPCNPTGKLVQGEELARWVAAGRELECSLLVDEFYSHYIWTGRPGQLPVESAARYVEDVDRDPVVVFDGFTKNWR
jgi:aspartate/methionine/tyrosine aminotransferase